MTKISLKYIGPLVFLSIVFVFLVAFNLGTFLDIFHLRPTTPLAPSSQPIVNVPRSVRAKYAPFELPKIDTTASQKEFAVFTQEIREIIRNHDFSKLEAKAVEYRESKARFIGGGWKLYSLSMLINSPLGGGVSDKAWESHLVLLADWKNKMPNSLTAHTALADAHIEYSWYIRGDVYSRDVPQDAWAAVHDHLEKAAAIMDEAGHLGSRSPEYYKVLLNLARDRYLDRTSQNKIYEEAIAYEPEYQYFYTTKAVNLMERWGGLPGEWEAFADKVKADIGGKRGLQLYYRMVSEVLGHKDEYLDFKHRASWEDAREGFRLINADYGVTRTQLNDFAHLTQKISDPEGMCPTFEQLKDEKNFDPDSWKDRESFEKNKKLAQQLCELVTAQKAKPYDPNVKPIY